MIKICKICSIEFNARREDIVCCSVPCSRINRTVKTSSKRCTTCLKTFYRRSGTGLKLWNRRKVCSTECRTRLARSHRIGFKKGHKGHKNSGNFLKGQIPWNKGKQINPDMTGLREWVKRNGSANKGKVVSEETREKIKAARAKQNMSFLCGENHHWWKGGITPLRNQIRRLYVYTLWRTKVFKCDDYTCQECNKRGGKLNADHIKSFSKILNENNIKTIEDAKLCDELWDISNGRTMCTECHQKTNTYGSKSIIKIDKLIN